ncbi:MAG: hypothetical protein JO230_17420 [Xanthobacteraceae bacterium]|nr:hypothetical protein [Xanthobacteraceae bacterium]
MQRSRRHSGLMLLVAVSAAFLGAHAARASDFPSRTVRIIIPFSAGGAPDVLFRIVAPYLSEKWKQPVVIENRPGGNTNIGTVVVTKAEPDGHTLLFTTDGTFIFNPLIYTSMPYSVSELAPVSMVATAPQMFAIGTHIPAKTMSEFIALAKSKPGEINYGSTGPASIQRLQMEYFMALTGVRLTHVPFRGANETIMAMLANQMDATITGSSNIIPYLTFRPRSCVLSPYRQPNVRSSRRRFPQCRKPAYPATKPMASLACSLPRKPLPAPSKPSMTTSRRSSLAPTSKPCSKRAALPSRPRTPLNSRRRSIAIP